MGDLEPSPDIAEAPLPPRPRDPNVIPLWEIIFLFAIDLVVFIIFASIGQQTHTTAPAQGQLFSAFNVAFPFIVPWVVVGGLFGLFSGQGLYPVMQIIKRTVLAVLIAIPIGLVLREALLTGPYFVDFQISLPFMLVAIGFCGPALLIWRLLWSRVRRLWWPEIP